MKRIFLISIMICLVICVYNCSIRKYEERFERLYSGFNTVSIETLVSDSTLNVRALELFNEGFVIPTYLTSDGRFGSILPKETIKHIDSLRTSEFYHHQIILPPDSLKLNFRAMAIGKNFGYGITIGNPALIYKLDADVEKVKVVYTENHPKVFYDAMDFWNDKEGITMGDPTDDCISIIITRDGGNTWKKLSCKDLPNAIEGEAAFAASDTNIAIIGDKTWIATGGMASRILYSPDKGKSWEIYDTPIIQGKSTTGIYSIDFYDSKNGFAIGGDYTDASANINNKIKTSDGGKTWQVVANGKNPGYRSCVQYIPNSNAQQLVAVGFEGIDYSNDFGENWKHLSDEGFYTLRFLNDSIAFAAGNGRISKLIFK